MAALPRRDPHPRPLAVTDRPPRSRRQLTPPRSLRGAGTGALDRDELTTSLLERTTFPPSGTDVTCAVSGGPDSLALLVLAAASGCRPTAVHVDHCLRPGSDREAGVVEAAAARLGAAFRAERVVVAPGPNLEARARAARFAVLPQGVLTGHTADDQAETVLLNLMRGAGLDGLAGMRPEGHPLIGVRRSQTRVLCAAWSLVPVDDPSNADPSFRRNRVRAELLPLLDAVAGRDVAAVLARQAPLLRDEADLLDALAAALDPTSAADLAAAPPPLARRAVRRWLSAGRAHPPDAATVERVLGVARGETRAAEVGDGRRVARSGGRLWLGENPGSNPLGPTR